MAIVRKIVEIHGGTVTAESPGDNQGAKFTVRLPLLQEDSLNVAGEKSNFSLSTSKYSLLAGIKILVVDDDTDSRDFLAYILQQEGAEVSMAASAVEGLQILAQSRLDVLVSDISMPDMNGYMMIREIRTWAAEQNGQISAIALTAFARQYDQEQALAAGFQIHLPKPVNAEELIAAVARLIVN